MSVRLHVLPSKLLNKFQSHYTLMILKPCLTVGQSFFKETIRIQSQLSFKAEFTTILSSASLARR